MTGIVACGGASSSPRIAPRTSSAAPPRAPVVITLVVDQLAAHVAESKWPALPESGGFARLRREGTWVTHLAFAHAVTDTAPGHSALYTGAVPRVSGIFANEVLDDHDAKISILRDDATRTVTPEGIDPSPSSSLRALRVPTLADQLRSARPDALIVGLSLKDRGALFGCGRHPDACLWLGKGELVGSTAETGDTFPAWARASSNHDAISALTRFVWRPTDEAWLRAHAGMDAQAGEGNFASLGTTFPHDFSSAGEGAVKVSPKADQALLDLALHALEENPNPQRPTLLAISLSTNDYVGHVFGPDSWEAWEEMRDLDAALARFFARLDALVGQDGWAIVLSGDHGVTRLPELQGRGPSGEGGGRIDPDELTETLRAAAHRAGFDGAVRGVADPYVVLSDDARKLDEKRRAALDAALLDALTTHRGVAKVYFARDLRAPCTKLPNAGELGKLAEVGDGADELVCESFSEGAGDLYVLPKPGWFFDTMYVPGAGASHGTPTKDDRTVPLLVRAPGRVPAGVVRSDPLPFATFTRTAADLLGVAAPPAASPAPSLVAKAATTSQIPLPRSIRYDRVQ